MPKLTSLFTFQGTLDDISVYKMAGIDQPIMRRKGGAEKQKILKDPNFVNTRRTMSEFGGRSIASGYFKQAFFPIRPGFGTTAIINKVLAVVQKMDRVSEWGRRNIALSLCPDLLQGLNISKRLLLDDVLQHMLSWRVSKESGTASIALPPFLPGVNCSHPKTHPFFRIIAVLGIMPDLVYHEQRNTYVPMDGYHAIPPQYVETAWYQTNIPSEATHLALSLPELPSITGYSLLLSVAVEYGKLGFGGEIEPTPKAVAAKVLAVE